MMVKYQTHRLDYLVHAEELAHFFVQIIVWNIDQGVLFAEK